jgi:hypothetical protein
MTTKSEVRAFLTGADREKICFFEQCSLGKVYLNMENEEQKEAAKDGFCTGVCLEWLRRVLQGGNASLIHQGNKDKVSRAIEKVKMSYRAQRTTKDPVLPKTKEEVSYEEWQRLKDHFIDLVNRDQNRQEFTLGPNAVALAKKCFDTSLPMPLSRNTMNALIDLFKTQEDAKCKAYDDSISARTGKSRAVVGWVNVVGDLDKARQIIRNQTTGRTQTKRAYAGIRPLESESTSWYEGDSPASAVLEALMATGFATGKGMIFDVGTGPSTGHAHGLYREAEDRFLFLDPNFGVFRYDQQSVLQVMDYLWLNGGTTKKGINSESDLVCNGFYRYSLFERN